MKPTTILVAALALLLCACNPSKQLQRFLKRNPELARQDTIRDTVRVMVPGDTVYKPLLIRRTDTVKVDTGRLHVRIVRVPTGSPCDTAALAANLTAWTDTIFKEVPVEHIVEKLVPCPEGYNDRVAQWWRPIAIVFAILFVLSLMLHFIRR